MCVCVLFTEVLKKGGSDKQQILSNLVYFKQCWSKVIEIVRDKTRIVIVSVKVL